LKQHRESTPRFSTELCYVIYVKHAWQAKKQLQISVALYTLDAPGIRQVGWTTEIIVVLAGHTKTCMLSAEIGAWACRSFSSRRKYNLLKQEHFLLQL